MSDDDDSPVSWSSLQGSIHGGTFLAHLRQHVAPELWGHRDQEGETLLHFCCRGEDNADAAAALIKHGLDPNEACGIARPPVYLAALNGQPRVLEVLLAAGARVTVEVNHETPLDAAVWSAAEVDRRANDCVRVLLAHGMRLRSLVGDNKQFVRPWMAALEQGVHRCWAVAVVLLGLKRRRSAVLRQLDRFVVREVAIAIHATRADAKWQPT